MRLAIFTKRVLATAALDAGGTDADGRRRELACTPMSSAVASRDRTIRRRCGPAILAAAPERTLDAAGEARVHLQQLDVAVWAESIFGLCFLLAEPTIASVKMHRTIRPCPDDDGLRLERICFRCRSAGE